jgi:peptidoglycan/xylan/chitin deacetylase (PgdA/CDA1 family)
MFKKIRIRDDDVLLHSTRWPDAFKRFKGFHNLVLQDQEHFIHVAAVLITEIQDYPEAIELIRNEAKEDRIEPQIHGLKHIDYGKLTMIEAIEHLQECQLAFEAWEFPQPTLWYTPWGATQPHLHESAKICGLTLIDTSNALHPGPSRDYLKAHPTELDVWQGKEILRHWWESVGALDEFVTTYRDLSRRT